MTTDELVKELRDLARADGCRASIAAADLIEALTAERDRLRLYARHDDDCTINRYPGAGACSCGLRAAHD